MSKPLSVLIVENFVINEGPRQEKKLKKGIEKDIKFLTDETIFSYTTDSLFVNSFLMFRMYNEKSNIPIGKMPSKSTYGLFGGAIGGAIGGASAAYDNMRKYFKSDKLKSDKKWFYENIAKKGTTVRESIENFKSIKSFELSNARKGNRADLKKVKRAWADAYKSIEASLNSFNKERIKQEQEKKQTAKQNKKLSKIVLEHPELFLEEELLNEGKIKKALATLGTLGLGFSLFNAGANLKDRHDWKSHAENMSHQEVMETDDWLNRTENIDRKDDDDYKEKERHLQLAKDRQKAFNKAKKNPFQKSVTYGDKVTEGRNDRPFTQKVGDLARKITGK